MAGAFTLVAALPLTDEAGLVLFACFAGLIWRRGMSACLIAGAKVLTLVGAAFSLSWIHSIEKTG